MRRTGLSKPTVRRWRDRFLAPGVDGLLRDATRPPGKKPHPDRPGDVAAPAACPAPDGAGAGREAGDGLHGILKENGLGPHRVGTFRVSRDVVGLCIDPPDHAVGLPVDESEDANATGLGERANRIQALWRTQEAPAREAGPCLDADARLQAARHDLPARGPRRRHRQGRVDRHRSQEFLAFPDPVAEGIAPGNPVHVILDNVSSHGSAEVHAWQKGRPDRTFRFTPTSASPTNAVEGFFPRLSRQRPKDAVFDSLDECITAIEGCIAHHDAHHARPFRWSRKPEDLVEACKGGHRRLREMAPDA